MGHGKLGLSSVIYSVVVNNKELSHYKTVIPRIVHIIAPNFLETVGTNGMSTVMGLLGSAPATWLILLFHPAGQVVNTTHGDATTAVDTDVDDTPDEYRPGMGCYGVTQYPSHPCFDFVAPMRWMAVIFLT